MYRLIALSLVVAPLAGSLTACTGGERASGGQCPAGEVCSDATPEGLHFVGADLADSPLASAFGPAPTAIGGTQDIALEYDRGDGNLVAFDLPFAADDDGGLGVAVDATSGAVVTVRGTGARSNYLRIIDPATEELYDRKELTGAAIASIDLVGTELERLPPGDVALVWATGDQRIGIALRGEERLIDTSMAVSMPGSQRASWDSVRVPAAIVGVSMASITAGDRPALQLPVEFVAGADSITVLEPPTLLVGSNETVCFAATNAGRYVYGLIWQYDVDGTITTKGKDAIARNCINVEAPAGSEGTTIEIGASAGGQALTLSVIVGPTFREVAAPAPATRDAALRRTSTAGERAARR